MKFLMFVAPCAAVITKPTSQKSMTAMKPVTKLSVKSAVSKALIRTALTTAARITLMTDITELAQRARINAECGEHLSPAETMELVVALESEKRICATWRKTAKSTGEKLEKAQTINAAAEKLVRCKGRYHSEQNYRALAALFGVKTPDLPPLDGESRAVTVENLQESAYRAGLTAGWNLGLANNNDGFNKCLAAHAAGIQVEAE
ncbi:hypothetical protein U4R25_25300 [Klebsiella pneumoniae]